MNKHLQTCPCSVHRQIELRRDACYRQLARAILGPSAPAEPKALAEALAEHAKLIRSVQQPSRPRRAA
jgi:hypothetical protein